MLKHTLSNLPLAQPRTACDTAVMLIHPPYRLTHYRLCPFSRSIRLALGELGLEAELVEEPFWEWRSQFLGLNPSGELPVLQLPDNITLGGVYAISEFLAEEPLPGAARGPELLPRTREDRAEARRLIDWFQRKFDREVSRDLLAEKLYRRLSDGPNAAPPDTDLLRAIRANLRYHLGYIGFLADQRRWLAGDDLTFADLAAAAQLSSLDYLGEVPWSAHPAAKAWYVRLKSRKSFRPLLADRIPGFAPPPDYANLDF
jgi:glutathione S-transferase